MSEPHFPKHKSCTGKHRYHSMKEAAYAARVMKQRGFGRFNTYLCVWCSTPGRDIWHVGHAPNITYVDSLKQEQTDE